MFLILSELMKTKTACMHANIHTYKHKYTDRFFSFENKRHDYTFINVPSYSQSWHTMMKTSINGVGSTMANTINFCLSRVIFERPVGEFES